MVLISNRLPNWFLLINNMQELNVPEKDVGELLVSLILDNRINGHIDQVNRLLECGDRWNPELDIVIISLFLADITSNLFFLLLFMQI